MHGKILAQALYKALSRSTSKYYYHAFQSCIIITWSSALYPAANICECCQSGMTSGPEPLQITLWNAFQIPHPLLSFIYLKRFHDFHDWAAWLPKQRELKYFDFVLC